MHTHHWPAQQRVHQGVDALAQALPHEIEALGARRVLIATTRSLASTALAERVAALLGERCAARHADMPAHSPVEAVGRLVDAYRAARADAIVALGGGSVIDGCKAALLAIGDSMPTTPLSIDALVQASRPTSEWGRDFGRPRMVAVPTTLSGAEFSSFAGITAGGRKHLVGHPLSVPIAVVSDPACTAHTPAALLLSTGARAVDHCVEGFCSVRANPYADATAVEAARLLFAAMPAIHANGGDLEARGRAQTAAWLSMQGRGGGTPHGASHGIGYLLGGGFGVPHGLTSCVMLPAVLRWNAPVNESRQREFMRRVGLDERRSLADHVESLFASLGLATRLSQVGVGRDRFETIAAMYNGSPPIATNPRKVNGTRDLVEILELAA